MTENEVKVESIYQRRLKAQKMMAKEKFEATFQNSQYETISIGTILSKVRKIHAACGIVLDVEKPTEYVCDKLTNNVGKEMRLHKATFTFSFINPDDPKDLSKVSVVGTALSSSNSDDKYMSKLYTSALKNLYKVIYSISANNEDDIDAEVEDDSKPTKPQKSASEILSSIPVPEYNAVEIVSPAEQEKKMMKTVKVIKAKSGVE